MREENIDRPFVLVSGDVKLHFEYPNQSLTLQGSSQALFLASPVWEKMLNPPFRSLISEEGNNNGKQDINIDFSEDNGEALLILLRIAHLQFHKAPSKLKNFNIFLALAILCDKDDCVGLIKPWLQPWVGNEGTALWDTPGYESWLFIAWVLGWNIRFQFLAVELVNTGQINDAGEILTRYGDVLPGQMPPDIIGRFCVLFIHSNENILAASKLLLTSITCPTLCSESILSTRSRLSMNFFNCRTILLIYSTGVWSVSALQHIIEKNVTQWFMALL